MKLPPSVWRWSILAVALLVAAVVTWGVLAVRPRLVTLSETRTLLGTFVTLTVAAPDETTCKECIAAGFARIEELEKVMSAHRNDSELAMLNANAAKGPVVVSEDLYRAIDSGVLWYLRTLGVFDITVAPLLELWRECGRANRLPTQDEIEARRRLMGASRIELDPAARTVRFPVEGMRLDLGGLGKGYCADAVVRLLVQRSVESALIAVAGDIFALGTRKGGAPWRVGVQDPRHPDSPQALITVLELSNMAVSTSGNYQRYVEIAGRRYSHIVDPRSGRTADEVPSVTVIGPDALTTDIMGTALSVLGVKDGLALVERMRGVEALFVTFDERNEPVLTRSAGFSRFESAPAGGTDYRK